MGPGSRGTSTGRSYGRLATGARRVAAVAVALGVFLWAVLPVLSFPLDSTTGSTACRMACADTADCCCKPAESRRPKKDRTSETELSTPATTESCPRDCATLTVVPGTSIARSAIGVHRLNAPGAEFTTHFFETHAATRQGLLEVARPRGPPTQSRSDLFFARVSWNTSGPCAFPFAGLPNKESACSDSSESRHPSVRPSFQPLSSAFEPRVFVRQRESHSVEVARGWNDANAHQHGGPHE
jgi:hypothetical protein